jgi:hypothetical protein
MGTRKAEDSQVRETYGMGPSQQELPFTKVPNIFLDEWVNILGLVEIRVVAAILRRTFGWKRKESGPLSVTELGQITRRSRPLVVKALTRLRARGIITSSRLSRQEPLAYGLLMRSEFQPLKEAPPPARQKPLPYDVHHFSSKENLTTENASVVKKTLPLSGKENFTTEPSVLIIDLKKEDLKKHTQIARATPAAKVEPVENLAAAPRVCGSKFTKKQIREYAWASHNFDQFLVTYYANRNQKNRVSVGLQNPEGWATAARRSGEHDEEIQEWLDDPLKFDVDTWLRAGRRASL